MNSNFRIEIVSLHQNKSKIMKQNHDLSAEENIFEIIFNQKNFYPKRFPTWRWLRWRSSSLLRASFLMHSHLTKGWWRGRCYCWGRWWTSSSWCYNPTPRIPLFTSAAHHTIVGPWKKRIMQTWPCMYISVTGWSCATVSYDFGLTGIKNQINGKTQPYWDIKLSKCPYISFNKMVGFCHLFDFNARQTKIIKHSCTWSPCIRGQGSGSHIFAWCTHPAGQKIYASYVH